MGKHRNFIKPLRRCFDRLMAWSIATFYSLSIVRKLMLGFSVLLILLVGISVYALNNLNRLNEINSSILNADLPINRIVSLHSDYHHAPG